MKNTSIKKLIFINVISVVLVAAMLATASLAWFTASESNNTPQVIQSGTFEIKLYDGANGDTYEGSNIHITNSYPMSDLYAKAQNDNIYQFQVKNTGTVDTMFRFTVVVIDDPSTGDLLTDFLRYEIRYSFAEEDLEEAEWEDEEATNFVIGETSNVSLKSYFDSLLINASKGPTAIGLLTGINAAVTDTERYFQIRFWIESSATTAVSNITATVTLTLEAIQAVGGATWDDFDA